SCPKASGRFATNCGPRRQADSTRCRSSATRCTRRRFAPTASRRASLWGTENDAIEPQSHRERRKRNCQERLSSLPALCLCVSVAISVCPKGCWSVLDAVLNHLSPACRWICPAHFFCGESKDR